MFLSTGTADRIYYACRRNSTHVAKEVVDEWSPFPLEELWTVFDRHDHDVSKSPDIDTQLGRYTARICPGIASPSRGSIEVLAMS